jgi:beta-lactamase regulating signal transducer with metallopeptidase domain
MPDVLPLAAAAVYAIWSAGMVILVGRSIRGFAALSRLVQTLPSASVEWQNELTALCEVQSPGKAPMLKIGAVATPMLVQTWRAAYIVVPTWLWESCTADQRTSILLHELAHYRRGDVWRQLALRLLVLPHWFNPVAWWAAGQFAAASEDACDDAAAGGDDPQAAVSYCKALLIISERVGLRPAPALAISGSSLTERVRRVLHPEFQKESYMSRFLILTTMIVLTGLATIRIQAAAQAPPAKSEAAKNEADKNEAAQRKSAKDEAAKTSDQSLLANGGFERSRDDSNDPVSWFATRWPKTPGHYLMAASSSVAHGGKRSVFVEIGDSHPDDQRVHYNWTTVAQHWQPGETYELSGWIKTEDVKKTAFIMVQFWDEEGKDGKIIGGATTQYSSPVTGTTDWTRASTRLKVPEGTGAVRIRAGLSSEGNRGAKAWFDDISLAKVAD